MARSSKPFAIEIEGAPELSRKLAEFEGKVGKKLHRKAARQAAKLVLASAKMHVPVQYGTLESSLKVKAVKRSRTRIGVEVATAEGMFQGDSFYGGFVELGTKERFHKSGKSVGRIENQKFSFLRPALYDNEEAVRRTYVDALREAIREEEVKRATR